MGHKWRGSVQEGFWGILMQEIVWCVLEAEVLGLVPDRNSACYSQWLNMVE